MMIRRLSDVADDCKERMEFVENLVLFFDGSWDEAQKFWNRTVRSCSASSIETKQSRRDAAEAAAITGIAIGLKAGGHWQV